MQKLIRITTVPLSLEKLLEGQLTFMSRNYKVIAVSADKKRLEAFGKNNGVDTFYVEMTRAITPLKDVKAVLKLYKFFKKEKPLIVHTHTPKAGIVGMLAAKMANVPIRLHTVAGLPLLETTGLKRKILKQVEKATYSLATKVYPNSYGLKEIILKEKFADKEKLKVLGKGSSNGIDTLYFDPEKYSEEEKIIFRKKLNIPEGDFIFVFVGRLVSDKGINELVTAFEKLNLTKDNTSLLLVGPFEEDLDPLKPETFRTIESHPKIKTTGYQVDVRPFFAISNILVFPSYREGFPNVVMQASAMKLPAIVTDINGCNEIIAEGENGVVVPVKNEEALFNAMFSFSSQPQENLRMGKNARYEICRYYERKEYWKLLLSEYRRLEKKHHKDKPEI